MTLFISARHQRPVIKVGAGLNSSPYGTCSATPPLHVHHALTENIGVPQHPMFPVSITY